MSSAHARKKAFCLGAFLSPSERSAVPRRLSMRFVSTFGKCNRRLELLWPVQEAESSFFRVPPPFSLCAIGPAIRGHRIKKTVAQIALSAFLLQI